ncbi:DUF1616 domain-containing protein [Halomarina ordinaria]|uniref:DUF1616 domain-containing protein n=1 Tax=Halomarina ordinaria TaxID=3033939 RepID=A0ABD5UDN0_9EURY|nr:DUF1616 domain-containing protein [Halomarina sp. PSRA2]
MSRRGVRSVGAIPFDLVLALVYLGAVDLLLLLNALGGPGSSLRVVLTLPAILFVPGYALAAAAFPRRAPDYDAERSTARSRASLLGRLSANAETGIDSVERAALGFGLSVALLPILGLVVAADPGPVTATTAAIVVTVLTAALALVATLRRLRVPSEDRYALPVGTWVAGVNDATDDTALDTALSVALAVSVVLAAGAFAVGLAAPKDGTQYEDFTVGVETEDGYLVQAGYPTDMNAGDSAELSFLLENNQDRATEYTVVIQQHRLDASGEVTQATELDRYRNTVEQGDSWQQEHIVTSQLDGERVRLVYLLYVDDVPENPSPDNADGQTYIEVQTPESETDPGDESEAPPESPALVAPGTGAA